MLHATWYVCLQVQQVEADDFSEEREQLARLQKELEDTNARLQESDTG
jgi:hypothetical protein